MIVTEAFFEVVDRGLGSAVVISGVQRGARVAGRSPFTSCFERRMRVG